MNGPFLPTLLLIHLYPGPFFPDRFYPDRSYPDRSYLDPGRPHGTLVSKYPGINISTLVNFLSTYSDKKSCNTSTALQTSIVWFVSDS